MTDSILKEIFENPGLYHIAQTVSSFLDAKSLSKCRLVCQSWRDLIDNDRPWLVFQLDYIHRQEKIFLDPFQEGEAKKVTATIEDRFPEWSAFIQQISKKQSIPRLQEVIKQMWIYFQDDEVYRRNPFHYAVSNSNLEFIQLLADCGLNLTMLESRLSMDSKERLDDEPVCALWKEGSAGGFLKPFPGNIS